MTIGQSWLDPIQAVHPGDGTKRVQQRGDERYQDARSLGSGTVSLTISHRSERQSFLSAFASLCRKMTMLSGWNATTKSLPSRLIETCRLKT
jgi:hypothetical protein